MTIFWVVFVLSVIVPFALAIALFLWWKATRHWAFIVLGLTACVLPIVQVYQHVSVGAYVRDEGGASPEEFHQLYARITAFHCLLWIALGVGGVGLALAVRRPVPGGRDLPPDGGG